MNCKTCISSREINRVLMCQMIDQPAVKVCRFYCYEPGTTDESNEGLQAMRKGAGAKEPNQLTMQNMRR